MLCAALKHSKIYADKFVYVILRITLIKHSGNLLKKITRDLYFRHRNVQAILRPPLCDSQLWSWSFLTQTRLACSFSEAAHTKKKQFNFVFNK